MSKHLRDWLGLGLITLVASLSLLPLFGTLVGPRLWAGFFYGPFYTTNVFTDPTTPAGIAGLQPEDRVVAVNRSRIENLAQVLHQSTKIVIVYELGRDLTPLETNVEVLGWARILDKWAVLGGAALSLLWWGYRKDHWFLLTPSVALFAGLDYWFNVGAGNLSGFDPAYWLANNQPLMVSAKWSAYLYWAFWTIAWGGLTLHFARQSRFKFKKVLYSLIIALTLGEIGGYCYDAIKSGVYNNPDYMVWHIRATFWWGWGSLLLLTTAVAWQNRRQAHYWLKLIGLLVFVIGFAYPTSFGVAWPALGPQYYAWGLLALAYRSNSAAIARSNTAR